MCAPSRLQQHIRNLTKDGELVARFLFDTVQGKTPGVKACHQMEALKYLDRYGFLDDANQEEPHFWGLIPTPEELAEKQREEKPPLPKGEGWGEGEAHPTQTAPITDNKPDCYYKPLTPEQQAIFDYQCKLESGEFEEGEISIVSPSEAARRQYAIDLKKITELAAAEGVPLLPNPLAGTLKRPNIRGP